VDPVKKSPSPPEVKGVTEGSIRRRVMITDFGAYLRQLRIDKGLTIEMIAPDVGYTPDTIMRMEKSKLAPPKEHRLRIWLAAIGESAKLPEALRLLRSVKRSRRVLYHINNPVNEHLDRILDAYENNALTVLDIDILSMVSLKEYTRGNQIDPHTNKYEIEEPVIMAKKSANNAAAASLGRSGGLKGGPARAKALSSTQRSEIAKKGGEAKAAKVKKSK
jgi:transcriptional regulator with XRE-family HTH domain